MRFVIEKVASSSEHRKDQSALGVTSAIGHEQKKTSPCLQRAKTRFVLKALEAASATSRELRRKRPMKSSIGLLVLAVLAFTIIGCGGGSGSSGSSGSAGLPPGGSTTPPPAMASLLFGMDPSLVVNGPTSSGLFNVTAVTQGVAEATGYDFVVASLLPDGPAVTQPGAQSQPQVTLLLGELGDYNVQPFIRVPPGFVTPGRLDANVVPAKGFPQVIDVAWQITPTTDLGVLYGQVPDTAHNRWPAPGFNQQGFPMAGRGRSHNVLFTAMPPGTYRIAILFGVSQWIDRKAQRGDVLLYISGRLLKWPDAWEDNNAGGFNAVFTVENDGSISLRRAKSEKVVPKISYNISM